MQWRTEVSARIGAGAGAGAGAEAIAGVEAEVSTKTKPKVQAVGEVAKHRLRGARDTFPVVDPDQKVVFPPIASVGIPPGSSTAFVHARTAYHQIEWTFNKTV